MVATKRATQVRQALSVAQADGLHRLRDRSGVSLINPNASNAGAAGRIGASWRTSADDHFHVVTRSDGQHCRGKGFRHKIHSDGGAKWHELSTLLFCTKASGRSASRANTTDHSPRKKTRSTRLSEPLTLPVKVAMTHKYWCKA